MGDTRTDIETGPGEGREAMIADMLLVVFCFVLALGALVTVVWELVTGRFFDMDGLWLTLISLTVLVVFGGNLAWSVYTGELREVFKRRS